MPDGRLDNKEEGEGPKQHRPGGINGDSEYQGKRGSYSGPDVRHEAQHRCQDAPQDRAWNSNQPQAKPDNYTERSVQKELDQEKPTETRRCVVECGCGSLQVMRTCQSDQSITKILAL